MTNNKLFNVTLVCVLAAVSFLLVKQELDKEETKRTLVPIERTIRQNETAWEIANEYKPDGMGKWEYMELCETANGRDLAYIYPGETVVFYAQK